MFSNYIVYRWNVHWCWWLSNARTEDNLQQRHNCTGFESVLEQQDLRMYWPYSYTTEKVICSWWWKILDKMALNATKRKLLIMKNTNHVTQWKNGPVDVTITHAIMHQKHFLQCGGNTRSAVDIFNRLRVFTKEPIREQEIKLECMNYQIKNCFTSLYASTLAANCNNSVCITDMEGRSQTSYTTLYNAIVSYAAQIDEIQVLADHTHRNKMQTNCTHDHTCVIISCSDCSTCR